MNNIVKYIFFFFCLFITSCTKKKEKSSFFKLAEKEVEDSRNMICTGGNALVIDVDDSEVVSFIDFSQRYVEDVKYIPIRKYENPIGLIGDVLINEEKIFVLDREVESKVYLFDIEGNFIRNVGGVGQGPGEYLAAEGINILNKEEPMLAVCDRNLFVYYYNLNGEFLKREKRFFGSKSIARDKSTINFLTYGLYGESKDNNYGLVVSSKDKVLYKSFRLFPIQYDVVNSIEQLHINNDECWFTPVLSDTTYQVLSDSTYCLKFVFKHKNTAWDDRFKQLRLNTKEVFRKKELTAISPPISETQDAIYFKMYDKEGDDVLHKEYFYLKKSKKVIYLSNKLNVLKNKAILNPLSNPINVFQDYFIAVLSPETIEHYRELREKGQFVFENEDLKRIIDEEKSVDTVIVLFKIKNL